VVALGGATLTVETDTVGVEERLRSGAGLIREPADPGLSNKARGRLVRELATT
jgi:hypothetical protein